MQNIKMKKTHILVAVYAALIIIELFFYVPYHSIQIFKTTKNVPHTETIGSGYATMADITNDNASIQNNERTSTGKVVNTSQLFINVSITTILAMAIYLLLPKEEEVKELPVLDVNALAFATDEEINQAQQDYAKKVYEYVKRKEKL